MARILIVDDDSAVRSVIEQYMIRCGYHVDTAVDGFDAIEKLALASYDLVLTDMVMPEMDGIKLISHIRDAYPNLKVIAISGGGESLSGATVWLERARQAGAAQILLKPFSAVELYELTSDLLEA